MNVWWTGVLIQTKVTIIDVQFKINSLRGNHTCHLDSYLSESYWLKFCINSWRQCHVDSYVNFTDSSLWLVVVESVLSEIYW